MLIEKKIKLSRTKREAKQEAENAKPRFSRFINDGWREKNSEDRRAMAKNISFALRGESFPTHSEISEERYLEFLRVQGGSCMTAKKV